MDSCQHRTYSQLSFIFCHAPLANTRSRCQNERTAQLSTRGGMSWPKPRWNEKRVWRWATTSTGPPLKMVACQNGPFLVERSEIHSRCLGCHLNDFSEHLLKLPLFQIFEELFFVQRPSVWSFIGFSQEHPYFRFRPYRWPISARSFRSVSIFHLFIWSILWNATNNTTCGDIRRRTMNVARWCGRFEHAMLGPSSTFG